MRLQNLLPRILLCLGQLALLMTLAVAAPKTVYAEKFHSGINVIFRRGDYADYNELDWKLDALFSRLRENNIDSISLSWLIYTESVQSSEVFAGDDTPENEAIFRFMEKAKAQGFRLMVRPILDEQILIKGSKNDWRGTIRPRDVTAWFSSYQSLMSVYATLAEDSGADTIVVGTELTSMERHREHWRHLIKNLRERFSGTFTYSSNQDVSDTFPWEDVDYIGVDAFFRLNIKSGDNSEKSMILAVERELPKMIRGAAKYNKPLLLTEIGITSQRNAHRRTWVWDHRTPVDLEVQRRFYLAACRVGKPLVSGIYWWAVSANPWLIANPDQDKGFSPLGKPAELEIEVCFE